MKRTFFPFLLAVSALLTGCTSTRSISDSGYRKDRNYGCPHPASATAFTYQGELSEFDVLDLEHRRMAVTDAEIGRALEGVKRPRLRPGSSILLVQSGAMFPDGPMVTELSKQFVVAPFSGVPPRAAASPTAGSASYSKSLRWAAAQGGHELILCYWGILESSQERLTTKTVSWVPIVNWLIPDERQHLRLRLKLALIDVRTGGWALHSPPPVEGRAIHRSPTRAQADQRLVEELRQAAYPIAVRGLVKEFCAATGDR